MLSVRSAVTARPTRPTETADETSSSSSSDSSLYELVDEDIPAPTRRLRVMNPDVIPVEERHDSVFDEIVGQAATIGTIGSLTARPPKRDLRSGSSTPADEGAALDYDGNGESIASMREAMNEGFARLNVHQQHLDQVVAHTDHKFSSHLEDDRALHEAQEAVAARERALEAQERALEAQIRAAREHRREAAERLGQRIVAEVVPMSAHGCAYGDVAEIRRCAAPKAEVQIVPDGSYPRFRLHRDGWI
jgi:hypothetical protein